MSNEVIGPEEQPVSFKDLAAETLRALIYEMSFTEYIEKVKAGLKAPHDTGEYRYAKQQVLRLWAPAAGITIPLLGLLILLLMPQDKRVDAQVVDIQVVEPSKVEIEPEAIKEPPPPEIQPQDIPPDIPTPNTLPSMSDSVAPGPPGAGVGPNIPFSPVPSTRDTVAIVRSPIKMKGIYGSRNPGSRGSALGRYGGGMGGMTEDAVMKALRWLKKNQSSDGSWPQTKPAMTGFALLTFLAHGETPASEEFGYTVERAIQYLISSQQADGHFSGRDGHDYSHPIATYALCEAYGLTKVPQIKEAAQKALRCIVQGQHGSGGFNYNLDGSDRDDTSYMAWCAQAMKAGKIAYVMDEPEKLDAAMRKAIDGFRKNYQGGGGGDSGYAQGGFGYTSPAINGLTGAGTLCMQLLGAAKEKEVKSGIETMKGWTFTWGTADFGSTIYYAYYSTQAKFHEGGEQWNTWNKQFAPGLCKNQTVIAQGIEGPKGKMVDIGYWDSTASGHSDGGEGKRVMTTCLCTLMLEVYYRYLPTFQTPQDIAVEGGAPGANNKKANEVKINVGDI